MPDSLSSLKRVTLIIYVLIAACITFLIHEQLMRIDLPINNFILEGEYQHIDREQINLITSRYIKGNFFKIDLKKIRKAFIKLPWVREASLRRKWPDKLIITIDEHKVIARWGGIGLINDRGEIFNAASEDNLPSFFGNNEFAKEITEKYNQINKILEKELMQVSIIRLSKRLSWEITTDNHIKIALGKKDILNKLEQFIKNYQFVLAELKSTIEYVDLRYKNGFSVRDKNNIKNFNKKIIL
ncbi:MAG: cell division protein FtsQ/DivIB [Methylophilaceae bacterium]